MLWDNGVTEHRFTTAKVTSRSAVISPRFMLLLVMLGGVPLPQAAAADLLEELTSDLPGKMRTKQGQVFFQARQRSEESVKQLPVQIDFGDAVRTHALSRAAVTITNGSDLYLGELTRLAIVAAAGRTNFPALNLPAGRARFISRGGPASTVFQAPRLNGINRGTEFLIEVETDRTILTLFDGEAEVSNADTPQPVRVRGGQQGIATSGKPIEVRAVILADKIVQWWIYYPGILNPEELGLAAADQAQLAASLAAYRAGALSEALRQYPGYPTPLDPGTEARRIYYSALLLSVGAVDRAEAQLKLVTSNAPLARALRTMIDAVAPPLATVTADLRRLTTSHPKAEIRDPTSSSELLALSYAHQATNNLKGALNASYAAVKNSSNFAFGWARVAELEFSFGRTRAARRATDRALALAPRHAQAHALNGFLLAAENKVRDAISAFDRAIEIDPALGNGWLGRGLCKIRLTPNFFSLPSQQRANARANSELGPQNARLETTGLDDLQVAAILEPNRSLLRSYLGKAFADAGLSEQAFRELDYAKHLDPNDPTAWLYSALLRRDENRINESVSDLERSLELNDNRAVYRSRFLLDEDRAVRSSSLANLYQSAGMNEVAVREAARGVSYDYANYSAHQFLSESYNALRDPTRFNLRYETVWFNELLLANLLSPVGGTPLSQHITQQEYSRFFDRNRLGLISDTQYRSDGQVREVASQFGAIGRFSYSLDLDYQHNDGVRPNNELDRTEWYSTFKYQLTAEDSVLLLTKYQDYHSGDNFQYYDPADARPSFSFDEHQSPIVVGGFHHEWQPGVHTLLLGGRLVNEQRFSDRGAGRLLLGEDPLGNVETNRGEPFDVSLNSELEIYTAEISQIFQAERFAIIAGTLWQGGEFKSSSLLESSSLPGDPTAEPPFFQVPPASGSFTEDFERLKGYGYLTLSPLDHVWITGGLACDQVTMPANFRHPPLSPGEETRSLWEPKAALVWSPLAQATLRGVYARSLGGVSLDESYRLEPTQLAGFPQAFRSVISESVAGSVSAPEFQTFGLALDLKPGRRTYAGIQAERIESDVRREIGVLRSVNSSIPYVASSTRENLDYVEQSLAVAVNQLVGDNFAFGLHYRFTDAELRTRLPEVPGADRTEHSELHRLGAFVLFNHASGWFARAEANWFLQENTGYSPAQPGDNFVHVNLFAGFRWPRSRFEVTAGILNLTDQDYRLNPLTVYSELPRERVFVARLGFRF